jgi:hypothetical protein
VPSKPQRDNVVPTVNALDQAHGTFAAPICSVRLAVAIWHESRSIILSCEGESSIILREKL